MACVAHKIKKGYVCFARRMKLDSSLLKAEHVHVLSPRAGLRRNDDDGGYAGFLQVLPYPHMLRTRETILIETGVQIALLSKLVI
jgi:hypothetical protein